MLCVRSFVVCGALFSFSYSSYFMLLLCVCLSACVFVCFFLLKNINRRVLLSLSVRLDTYVCERVSACDFIFSHFIVLAGQRKSDLVSVVRWTKQKICCLFLFLLLCCISLYSDFECFFLWFRCRSVAWERLVWVGIIYLCFVSSICNQLNVDFLIVKLVLTFLCWSQLEY